MPLLVDEHMHYRFLKVVYSPSYAKFNVPMFLNKTLVAFGVWQVLWNPLLAPVLYSVLFFLPWYIVCRKAGSEFP